MKCAGKARNNGLYRHIRTSKEIIRNMLMEVYETDANSLLAIECTPDSLDSRLKRLPADKQDYLKKTFDFMIEQALKSA
mgnify:CR=1 FL=1